MESVILHTHPFGKYQPSGAGGTRSPPATPHRLQNPKWPPGGPEMADGVWKEKKEKKIITFLVATNVVASQPPERRPTGTPTARANILMLCLT